MASPAYRENSRRTFSNHAVPTRPAHGRDRRARLPRSARLVESAALTSTGTIRLRFDVIDDGAFDFLPGQFVAIDMIDRVHGYRRSPYCLMDGSEAERRFELLIRRVAEGPVSLFLTDLEVGDVISFRGPSGHSMMPTDDSTDLVMLATGVGLSPCYCLVRRLQLAESRYRIRLYWGLRLHADICMRSELDALKRANRRFDYRISLSGADDRWTGLRGRVTESVPPLLSTLGDKHFYLVSNGEMIAEMSTALQNLGVARERIYEESFFNHRYRPDADTIRRVEARFVADDVERPLQRLERELSRYAR